MNDQVSIKKNTILNIMKSLMTVVFPLITFPYISRVLGAENVGKINFGNSIVSYISLIATLGVTTYAVRECSKVRTEKDKLNKIASQIYSINIVSTIIAYVVLFLVLTFCKSLENYRQLIIIQSSVVLFTTLGTDWINTAMEDFKYITYRSFVVQIISLICMFIFVREPDHYMRYALICVLSSSGGYIINMFYRKKFCTIRFTLDCDVNKHLPPILLMFSLILTQTIYVNSDMTLLGLFRGDYEVGLYSVSVKIYTIVNTLVSSIAFVVMPRMSELFAKKDYKEINNLIQYTLNCIITLGLPCIVGINVITKEIIEIIAGTEYMGASTSLHILTIALLISFFGGILSNVIMLPSGREKICLKASLICSVVNVVANILLIPKYGLNAAAFTTALAETVGLCIMRTKVEKEIVIDHISKIVVAPLIGCGLIVLVGAIGNILVNDMILRTIFIISGSIVAYLSCLIIFKHEFTMEIINPLLNKFRKK